MTAKYEELAKRSIREIAKAKERERRDVQVAAVGCAIDSVRRTKARAHRARRVR